MKNFSQGLLDQRTGFLKIAALGICLALLTGSCNNSGKSDSEKKDSTSTSMQGTVQEDTSSAASDDLLAIRDETYYLKLEKKALEEIFAYSNVRQLNFNFIRHKKRYAVQVYGVDANGQPVAGAEKDLTVIETEDPVKNPKNLKRLSQVMRRGDMKRFLGLPTGTADPIATFKDMYFKASAEEHPTWPGKKYMHLMYADDLDKLKAMSVAGEGYTNPSPPYGSYCSTACDE